MSRPHQKLDPAVEERIAEIHRTTDGPHLDPLEQLGPVPVPNNKDTARVEQLVDTWVVEMTARDDVVIQYTSPRANGNVLIQYLDITLFSNEVPPGTKYVRFSRLASGHSSWTRRQLHRDELVEELTDRLTSWTPMNTTPVSYDGTFDWLEIGTRDELGSPITDDPDPSR